MSVPSTSSPSSPSVPPTAAAAVAASKAPLPADQSAATTAPTTGSLYVGELHPDVTEAMLYEVFSQIGPISSIRVCRDAITRRSLGYAYVNFHNASDCERALDVLNFTPIRGVPCRLMWSQRDPSLRRSGLGNIFIKNLHPDIDNKTLYDTFGAFGRILSCKVVVDAAGVSKGFGFVHFETQEAADEAIAKVNGMLLNGVKVYVGKHLSRKERFSQFEEQRAKFTNVFVKNLPESVDDEALSKVFGQYGEIVSAVVQRDESNQKSRGFGFVNYADHEQAAVAVEALHEKPVSSVFPEAASEASDEVKGEGEESSSAAPKLLFVGRAQKRVERQEELRQQFERLKLEKMTKSHGVNLYVKNLDESVTDESLRAEFAPFGTITSCKVMVDEKGASKGFGFVCYAEPEEAIRALNEMSGRMVVGKPVYVAFAQPREERRAQLQQHFAQRAQQLRMQAMAATAASGMNIYQQGAAFYQHQQQPNGMMMPAGAVPPRFVPANPNMRPPMTAAGAAARGAYAPRPSQQQQQPQQFRRPPYQQQQQQQSGASGNQQAARNMTAGGASSAAAASVRPQQRSAQNANRMPANSAAAAATPLTAAALAAAPADQQRRMLGERLYPLVYSRDAEMASKITGMLLEMDRGELLHLLEDASALTAKVNEAQEVLRRHQASMAAAAASKTSAA